MIPRLHLIVSDVDEIVISLNQHSVFEPKKIRSGLPIPTVERLVNTLKWFKVIFYFSENFRNGPRRIFYSARVQRSGN
ncbi:Calpain-C-like protein [Daphnia magna]|uniref:Calpain-C-like protein n=1 Tax=Daphnia magna TaxID=35525 RepID=A0A164Y309_9CRUS|nr:Calpain-C-like protein [Daphnia magna]